MQLLVPVDKEVLTIYDMTNFIDPEISDIVLKFINTKKFGNIGELYKTLKEAYDLCIEDYEKFPNGNTIESLDMKYDDDKGRFYTKYKRFVEKCKEIDQDLSISGYGGAGDIIKIKIRDICRGLDYNFPYGWKHNVR